MERITRRNFIASSAALTLLPSGVLGRGERTAANSKITAGIIGVGGQGINDMKSLLQFDDIQVVSVSDPMRKWDYSEWWYRGYAGTEPAVEVVNRHYGERRSSGNYDGCSAYADFREMLEKEDLDAVLVATTDHVHAVASMAALKKGLHVYCEKPLTYTVHEARRLGETARAQKVATQMGNQGQASEETRRVAEFIADGAIGAVHEVHTWTNRPIWPQGMRRPVETPPVPDVLDWDLWVGPAPMRPYHPSYIAVRWRGWMDFGTGALGDMACHELHPVFKALNLGHPVSVEASYSQPIGPDLEKTSLDDSWPVAAIVRYEFPARGDRPPVSLVWYDGGIKPARPDDYESGRRWGESGTLYIGDKGKMLDGRLIPESKMKAYTLPPKTLPRSPGHFEEWIRAIKGGEAAGSDFEFASMLAEVVLLGNVALRTGKKLLWDGPNLRITNDAGANDLLHYIYREGWTL